MSLDFVQGIVRNFKTQPPGASSDEMTPMSPSSRRSFLKKSTLLGLAAAPAALLIGGSRASARADATPGPTVEEELTAYFREIQSDENSHVTFLVNALGKAARPMPTFQNLRQKNAAAFLKVSQALENTGVGAYLGAAPSIDSRAYLAAAGSIFAIEARHAGYLNSLQGDPLTGNALDPAGNEDFETPLTIDQIVANASPFIKSLNGGPALTFNAARSLKNDISILNFALALEYLEREFYNTNVHLFFSA